MGVGMTAVLLAFAKKYWSYGAILLLASGLVAGFAQHERIVGRQQVLLAGADSALHVAQSQAADWHRRAVQDSGRAFALEADTAQANQRARLAETRYAALQAPLAASRHTLDSLLALPHDSASNGLIGATNAYLAHSDSSLHACGSALTAADTALAACQAHGEALQATLTDTRGLVSALTAQNNAKDLQIKVLRSAEPSAVGTWVWRAAAFGLGLLAGKIIR